MTPETDLRNRQALHSEEAALPEPPPLDGEQLLNQARDAAAEAIRAADPSARGALHGLLDDVENYVRAARGDARVDENSARQTALGEISSRSAAGVSREHGAKSGVSQAIRAIVSLKFYACMAEPRQAGRVQREP